MPCWLRACRVFNFIVVQGLPSPASLRFSKLRFSKLRSSKPRSSQQNSSKVFQAELFWLSPSLPRPSKKKLWMKYEFSSISFSYFQVFKAQTKGVATPWMCRGVYLTKRWMAGARSQLTATSPVSSPSNTTGQRTTSAQNMTRVMGKCLSGAARRYSHQPTMQRINK